MANKFVNEITRKDCLSLRDMVVRYLESNPVAIHVLAKSVGISVGSLRSLLSQSRTMNYPQRVKLRSFFERIG